MSERQPKNYMRKNKIEGQFAARTIAMLESPAYQVLSLSAHRVLARLEIELAHHGGNDNGKLPVTKEHFMEYGVHDHAVAQPFGSWRRWASLRSPNGAGPATPSTAALTDSGSPTGTWIAPARPTKWSRIKSMEDAAMLASVARRTPGRKHFPVAENAECRGGNHHRNRNFPVAETATTGQGAETTTTSISRDPRAERAGQQRL